jgi:hypothetical protein
MTSFFNQITQLQSIGLILCIHIAYAKQIMDRHVNWNFQNIMLPNGLIVITKSL